ncbi:MAG: fructokinase [Ramlibacter sp.]|nr:fructokinase [Ramlibacter sp.]MBX3659558.1 fructokinase [Ramlibacter sp.]
MTRVAVFGEMLVDLFDSGPVVGGAPFNVARHLAALGHAPLMLSAVGADAQAQPVMAELDRYRMTREGVQVLAACPTGVVDVATRPDRSHSFSIRTGCAWDHIALPPARAAVSALAPDGWLYSGTLALRSPVSAATGLALLRQHTGPCFVDLNWREGHVAPAQALAAVRLARVLKVNDEELAMLSNWLGGPGPQAPLADAARHVLDSLGGPGPLALLLVTCGADGALAFDAAGTRVAQGRSTRPVQLVDTVGAGDSFAAVVLAGLMRGWPLADTLVRATDFAAHVCEVRGAVPAELQAYADWTRDWPAVQDQKGL